MLTFFLFAYFIPPFLSLGGNHVLMVVYKMSIEDMNKELQN